jgi:predicted ATPase/serine/threonine protein kinase/DNA-binding CsgD family transcriptional regulator
MRRWRVSNREGQQLGNYRLLHLIGQGSFAEVYLGEHLHLNTQAAIKVLHTQFTSEEKEQFYTEARTLARLIHPHIIRIHDFAVEDGIPFLVMDYAPNGSLRQSHPRGTRVPLATIVSYVKQVAEALDYIHEQKLIHRDVKPENMLLGRNNEVLLTEFDIAIIAQSSRSQQTQEAAGAVAYMAPEQLRGRPRTASDQYSLAVVVYEWLSGAPPFSGSFREIVSQHLSASPPPLYTKAPTISPAIEHVVFKALAKDPKERFASVQAFARALEEAFNPESPGRTLFTPSFGDLTQSEQKRPSLGDLPTGTVTLLFTDIEASTRLLQQLGEHYADVLAEFRQLLHTIFYQYHGYEVDRQGDAFFVAFARATDAVSAAIAIQHALADHPWPEGVSVRLRFGLHTGEPLLTREGYVGPDVQQAARIMNAGHGGQILLSQTTSNLVEQDLPDDVKLDDLGEHRFKDLGRPKRIFQLILSDIPASFPPLKTLDTYPNNLPVQHTPFIGREQEVAAVCDLLHREDTRLLTLTGPGGAGKTRLALQSAAELSETFIDGVFFVNLAPISDPALVVLTTAETLSIREGTDQSLLVHLKENLRQKHVLLLLDNFEQVVSAAVQIVELLAACPRLKVMVTSREVLHVRAEHEFPVPPLPLPDPKSLPDLAALSHYTAVALFIQRAQAVKPDFQLTNSNARTIAEICARLDGLPLAIELAAARIKLLPPQALLARIDQRLVVLTSASRDVPTRQQTLRNTITWSYDLLDAREQQLFRRLSIFVGGCTIEAAEAVCIALDNGNRAIPMLDQVASLMDKSLLQQSEQEGGEPRFVMLETIREYGLEALAVNGEREGTRRAHAAYYLGLTEDAGPGLWELQQAAWLERLEREHDNLRAAMLWLLEQGETGDSVVLASRFGGIAALICLSGLLALQQGDVVTARLLGEESVALFREMGDQWSIVQANLLLAQVAAQEPGGATTGDALWAARLWGAAESLREAIGRPMPAVYRAEYERSVAAARTQLGEQAFAHAWVEGRTMTVEQALAAKGQTLMPTATPIPPATPAAPAAKPPFTYPDGLTAREVEVLRLLAQGLSNAQIAEQLVLSRGTVNWYLTTIYSKIGVSSRNAATRYAIDHKFV